MRVYYNDHDADVCDWLRELIKRDLLPDGEVDDRSILDVRPDDLTGFRQCHFFAGIGGWSYALRLAGVPLDWSVWTGSPPCQPFSAAGKHLAADDPRHLAPHFAKLVGACRPGLLFGEQVASSAVFGKVASGARKQVAGQPEWAWLDDLSDRLEAARYAIGTSDLPVAGFGGYHIRQRTFFVAVADADDAGPQGRVGVPERPDQRTSGAHGVDGRMADAGVLCGMADAECGASERHGHELGEAPDGVQGPARQQRVRSDPRDGLDAGGMADADGGDARAEGLQCCGEHGFEPQIGGTGASGGDSGTGAPDSIWNAPDWILCRDGKWRPVEPGTFPLAHGIPARVVRLRGYGNAISPVPAAAFIRASLDAIDDLTTPRRASAASGQLAGARVPVDFGGA